MEWIKKKLNQVCKLLWLQKSLKTNEKSSRKYWINLLSLRVLNLLLFSSLNLLLSNKFVYLQVNGVNPVFVGTNIVVDDSFYLSLPATVFSSLYFFILYPIFRGRIRDSLLLVIFGLSLCLGIYRTIGWSDEVNNLFGISILFNILISILVFFITYSWVRIINTLSKVLRERISIEEQAKLNDWWADLDAPPNWKEVY